MRSALEALFQAAFRCPGCLEGCLIGNLSMAVGCCLLLSAHRDGDSTVDNLSIGDADEVGDNIVGNTGGGGNNDLIVSDARGGGKKYAWTSVELCRSDDADCSNCSVSFVISVEHIAFSMASMP